MAEECFTSYLQNCYFTHFNDIIFSSGQCKIETKDSSFCSVHHVADSDKYKPFDMTRAGTPDAAIAEQRAYLLWLVLIFLCHLRHVFVGANILPPRHMFPKAP